jgi:hypothetical protein
MLTNANISMIYCEIGFLRKNPRHTYIASLSEWLAEKKYHFFGLYQVNLNGWKTEDSFGNALNVHKDLYNP